MIESAELGGRRHFSLFEPAVGVELWSTDGTDGGTGRVVDLAPGPSSSWPSHLIVNGDRLAFHAWTWDGGHEV